MRILVLTPRVPPGVLTLEAWDALRSAVRVVAAEDDAHVRAIVASGIEVEIGGERPAEGVWIAPTGDAAWARDTAARIIEDASTDVEVVFGSHDLPGARLLDLVSVMDRLRRDCAWTQQQTHAGLAPYLLEEAHEAVEALDVGDSELLREELGDLLMQVVFHAAIAAEQADGWDVDDVAAGITEKLVRRNPHVFAGGPARTPEEIDATWQRVKATEKQRSSPMDGIAQALPALALAAKVLGRVPDLDTAGDDVGARLLRLVAEARAAGVDAEGALRRAVRSRLP